jgi:hypothetical protein
VGPEDRKCPGLQSSVTELAGTTTGTLAAVLGMSHEVTGVESDLKAIPTLTDSKAYADAD